MVESEKSSALDCAGGATREVRQPLVRPLITP
jgi:hypothetical protein